MTTVEPHVEIRNVQAIENVEYGAAGKIALVGAFPSVEFKLGLFTTAAQAKAAVVDSGETTTGFKAYDCLDYIFNSSRTIQGPESVVIVNTNYGKQETSTNAMTNAELGAAFVLLAEEDFDILTLGEPITLKATGGIDAKCETIKAFVNSQFLNQKPFGVITSFDLTGATATELATFKTLFNEQGIYKAVVTQNHINGDVSALTLEQSAAWQAAYTAGRAVNLSETAKTYPTLIGNNTKDQYPASTTASVITFNNLRENGFHTIDYKDRRQQIVKCISNITPVGYDMKIERVKNYMVKRLALSDYLGEDHTSVTKDMIKGRFEYERGLAIRSNLITDMQYTLISVDAETVKAQVELYIPEILRVIKMDVVVKITDYSGGV